MSQGFAWFTKTLVGESQVIVRISVVRSDRDSGAVCLHGFVESAGFVKDITEIEESQRVSRIDFYRPTIMILRLAIVLLVVVDCSQIDTGGCMLASSAVENSSRSRR